MALDASIPETKKKAGIRRGETDWLKNTQSFAGIIPEERNSIDGARVVIIEW